MVVITDAEIASLSDYAALIGHFSLPTLLQVTETPSVATLLREPRARLLSHYAFWRLSAGTPGAWRGLPSLDHAVGPLVDFLAEPLVAQNTDNLFCRMLLHGDDRIPEDGFISADDIPAVASIAVAALDTLGFVGVLELGDSMWQGLSRLFGVDLAPVRLNATESLSVTANAPGAEFDITSRTLDLLEARTAADGIIYRNALNLMWPGTPLKRLRGLPQWRSQTSSSVSATSLARLPVT
jgi:hypothetical protein